MERASSAATSPAGQGQQPSYTFPLTVVTALFFMWGLLTSLNDILIPHLKSVYSLTYVQAMMVNLAFFSGYFLLSVPAGALIRRTGYKAGAVIGLAVCAVGAALFYPAATSVYELFLFALFVLAAGITILQVAANPYVTVLGAPATASSRLNLTQAFNSLGTFLGPLLGAHLFLAGIEVKEGTAVTEAARADALAGIDSAYFWISGLIAALALFFFFARKVVTAAAPAPSEEVARRGMLAILADAFSSKWALLGGAAIFLYVGAEVAIGTQMALFLNSDEVWGRSDSPFGFSLLAGLMGSDGVPGVSLQEAGKAVALYWGGAMVGRFIGAWLLRIVAPGKLLTLAAIGAAALVTAVLRRRHR